MRSSAGGEASMIKATTLRAWVVGLCGIVIAQWIVFTPVLADSPLDQTRRSYSVPGVDRGDSVAAVVGRELGTAPGGKVALKRVSPRLAEVYRQTTVARGAKAERARRSLPERMLTWIAKVPSELLAAVSGRARGWFSVRPRARGYRIDVRRNGNKAQWVGRTREVAAAGKSRRWGRGERLAWAPARQHGLKSERPRGWLSIRASVACDRTDLPYAGEPACCR